MTNKTKYEQKYAIRTKYATLTIVSKYGTGTPLAHDQHLDGTLALGSVLMGGSKSNLKNAIESNNMSTSFINPEHYWSVENYGTISKNDPIMMSKDEKRTMSILQTSTVLKNQRYEIPLLWKEDHPKLPKNKELALQRLYSLEKKLQKSPELEEKYSDAMKEYTDKGYAIKLSEREANKTSNITNYIPHHCALHPKKPNKVRVAFDASAKYKNDTLNNHLLKGPDLINNLVSILIQFRPGKYAVTADIEQMFHQVKVKKSDQDALRFLWRFLKTEKPKEYAMTVHLFGKNDSPCCSNYALKQCAKDQLQSENVIECVDNNFYMDDFVKLTSSEKYLLQICQVIIKVLASANFTLHKWITNSSLICETLPRSEVSDKSTDLNEQTIEKILGIIWRIKGDTLKVDLVRKTFPATKTGVLSQ